MNPKFNLDAALVLRRIPHTATIRVRSHGHLVPESFSRSTLLKGSQNAPAFRVFSEHSTYFVGVDSMSFLRQLLLATMVLAAAFSTPASVSAADVEEDWRVIFVDNTRVGYGRYVSRKVIESNKPVFVTEVEEHFTFRRFGQLLQMDSNLRIRETADGEILSYTLSVQNPPALSTVTKGTVNGNKLTLETTIGSRRRTRNLDWNRRWKSPGYQQRVLEKQPLKAGEKRTFEVFVPELEKPSSIHMSADDIRSVKMHDGKKRRLLKIRVTTALIPQLKTRIYTDAKGLALRTEMDPVGMVTFAVTKKVALEKIVGKELDVAVNALVKVKKPPVNLQSAKRVVYRITTSNRDPLDFFSAGPGQSVKRIDANTIELTLQPLPIPKNKPATRKQPDGFLAESQFLQIKDFRVRDHARKAGAGSSDPGTIAARMQSYVYRAIKKKGFSTLFASAAEVAENLEGDCTEHSCLLTAMLRAHRIPARVTVGLVYADQLGAFSSHMWTEAWLDGKWVALDATLSKGFGAGHLKVIDADLSDKGLTPALAFAPMLDLVKVANIEVIRVER